MESLDRIGRDSSHAKRGQTSIEIMSIAVVMAVLLLLVLVSTYNRNAQTQDVFLFNRSNIQCNAMASSIARLYSNRGIAKETLHLEFDANFLRVEGNPGSISIGRISCFYIGHVGSGALNDTDGINLLRGDWCFEKDNGGIAVDVGQCS
jgi:hypothetical protein